MSSMPDTSRELVVVIRTVNERTLEASKALVLKQVPEQDLYIVSEQPFELTLRRCYEIGINSGAEWMMTLDADVLLREEAIEEFLAEAKRLPPQCLQVEGLIFDKLTGLYRKAGHRMYRTQYLKKALECIPAARAEIRPEYSTLKKMETLGYPSVELQTVFGIHDFEQYYADIYRKAFVHANKHPEWVPRFIQQWKCQAPHDLDFQVALRALYDGLISLNKVCIDRRDYLEGAHRALEEMGIQEKTKLPSKKLEFLYVKSVLSKAEAQPPALSKSNELAPKPKLIQRFKAQFQLLGPFRLGPYLFGVTLCKMGERIKTSVSY